MIIVVYSFKGGQGKTKISLNLALTMDYGVITNDLASDYDLVLPENRIFVVPQYESIPVDFEDDHNIIYDLAGAIDNRIPELLKRANFILVPIAYENEDDDNIRAAVKTIDSIEVYNKNIVLIANKTELKKSGHKVIQDDFAEIKKAMEVNYQYPIFVIRKSKVVSKIAKEKKSIRAMVAEGGLSAKIYEDINKQFDDIIEYLTINYNNKQL